MGATLSGVTAPLPVADASSWVHGLAGRWPALDHAMTWSADYLIIGGILVVAALWFHRDGLRAGLAAALGVVLALAVGALVGAAWSEQRPFVAEHFAPLVAHSADASFPSDHLLALGAVAGATWIPARRLSLVAVALAVVVAFARVFVGIHYVQDVAAGFAIGAVCGLAAWPALRPVTPLLARLDALLQRLRARPVLMRR